MTDMGLPDADIPGGGFQAIPRLTPEIAEVMAVALLGAFVLYVLAFVGAALVSVFIGPPMGGPDTIAQILEGATEWANPLTALLTFAAEGAIWWQLRGCSDVVEEFEADRPTSSLEDDLRLATRYLRRGRALSSACIVTLGVLAAGQIGFTVSEFILFGSSGFGDAASGQDVRAIGTLLATGVLVVAGFWLAMRERSDAATACSLAERRIP